MQAPSPAAAPPAPPRPHGPEPGSPGSRLPARGGRPGARGRRAAAERGGGGKGRQGAAQLGSPLGKSSGSLLLAKANTALFFPDRANAPRTRAATQRAPCRVLGVFREGAGRAEPPLGKFPRRLRTQRAPGGPQGAGLAAEAANAPSHHPRAAENDRRAGNPVSLLAAEDAVGQAGCGLPLLPAEAATATAPTPA